MKLTLIIIYTTKFITVIELFFILIKTFESDFEFSVTVQ